MDGTGPMGRGPATGWGMGPCGRGFRRGWRRRMRGRGRMPFSPREMGSPRNRQEEKQDLEAEERELKQELEAIQQEKQELEKEVVASESGGDK